MDNGQLAVDNGKKKRAFMAEATIRKFRIVQQEGVL